MLAAWLIHLLPPRTPRKSLRSVISGFRYPRGIHRKKAVIRTRHRLYTGLFTVRPQVTRCDSGDTEHFTSSNRPFPVQRPSGRHLSAWNWMRRRGLAALHDAGRFSAGLRGCASPLSYHRPVRAQSRCQPAQPPTCRRKCSNTVNTVLLHCLRTVRPGSAAGAPSLEDMPSCVVTRGEPGASRATGQQRRDPAVDCAEVRLRRPAQYAGGGPRPGPGLRETLR
jgi:hypothetical protein